MVTAEADLPEGVWIPGDVQLYRDGSYIGSTFWQAQAKERLVLPFGRDDRVQVTTHRTTNRSGSAGLLGGRWSARSPTSIPSPAATSCRSSCWCSKLRRWRSPTRSASRRCSLPQPKLRNWEERRGVVAWEQSLAPGEALKFIADYTITYPKDASVIGLP